MKGLLYDLDDASKPEKEFEEIRDLIDNKYLKDYNVRVEVLEYLANNLDMKNPPSSRE